MNRMRFVMPRAMFGAAGVLCVVVAICAEPAGGETGSSKGNKSQSSASGVGETDRVDVAVARDRATMMHNVYTATLHMMHDRYFHGDRAAVPARAMEDVFSEIKWQSKIEARWISVNTKAMSVDHEPKSNFEKLAAKEIAAGKPEIEVVEDGYYRRAGAILLTDGCISCHTGFFKESSKTPKFSALIISVPVVSDSAAPK